MTSPSLPFTGCDFDHWITQSWRTDRRYYQAEIVQDLFGTWVLKRSWGGLGSRRRMSMTQAVESYSHALQLLEQVGKYRQKRGYSEC